MLSNAYFLAKLRIDTAENEPAKNLQNLQNVANFTNSLVADARVEAPGRRREHRRLLAAALRELGLLRRGAGDEPGVDFGRLLLLLGRVRRSTFRTRGWESS